MLIDFSCFLAKKKKIAKLPVTTLLLSLIISKDNHFSGFCYGILFSYDEHK